MLHTFCGLPPGAELHRRAVPLCPRIPKPLGCRALCLARKRESRSTGGGSSGSGVGDEGAFADIGDGYQMLEGR